MQPDGAYGFAKTTPPQEQLLSFFSVERTLHTLVHSLPLEMDPPHMAVIPPKLHRKITPMSIL